MANKLKDYYGFEYVESLSSKLSNVTGHFDAQQFLKLTKSQINELEFNMRQELIANALYETIHLDYQQAISAFTKILGPELQGNSGVFSEGWWL